jgi:hypothetical protein
MRDPHKAAWSSFRPTNPATRRVLILPGKLTGSRRARPARQTHRQETAGGAGPLQIAKADH